MLFFDECIEEEIAPALKQLRVPATDVRLEGLHGEADDVVAAAARAMGAIFVTYDMDFTTTASLVIAMARLGVCVVMIRRRKVKGPRPSKEMHVPETAYLVLRYFRSDWPSKCAAAPSLISCSVSSGSRARPYSTLPWARAALGSGE